MLATGGVIAVSAASATPADATPGETPVRAATGTTVNTGVHVSLYDYWDATRPNGPAKDADKQNVNSATGGSEDGTSQKNDAKFQFGGQASTLGGAYGQWNDATKDNLDKVKQGIVKNKLSANGVPEFSQDADGQSDMSYLFPEDSSKSDYAIAYNDVTGLFGTVTGNHYLFDASQNFAEFDKDTKHFTIQNQAFLPGKTSAGKNDDDMRSVPKFLPFNTLDEMNQGYQDYLKGNARHFAKANYAFGMKVTANFMQPKDGKVTDKDGKSEDMVFNFTGDDDVWVYVDGALVLDIGGIHSALSGSINFATGEVKVDGQDPTTLEALLKNAGVDTTGMVNGRFPDYSGHTLSFFYLERGHGASNCKLDFNLQTVPDGTVMVGKKITNSNTAEFSNASFQMSVSLSEDQNGKYETYVGDYYVCTVGQPAGDCQKGEKLKTEEDGKFTIENNRYALLVGNETHPIKQNTWYRVTEYAAGDYEEGDYKFTLDSVTDTEGGSLGKDLGEPSAAVRVDKHPLAMVNNSFQKKDKYVLAVKKVMADGSNLDTEFTVKVTYGDANKPYTGEYFHWEGGQQGAQGTAESDGSIRLEAGEEIRILGIDPGTSFKVEETGLSSEYGQPMYSCAEGRESSANPCTVTVGKTNQKPTVTVTNSLNYRVSYSPFKITKQLDGAPLEEHQFRFQVSAIGDQSARKAGFTSGDNSSQQVSGCVDSDKDGVVDRCEFTNSGSSQQAGQRVLARNANELTFTTADIGQTFVYEYKELDKNAQGEDLPDTYVLDKHTYRVEISVKDATQDSKTMLAITTTVKKSTETKPDWSQVEPFYDETVKLANGDTPKELAVVPFVNQFNPVSELPLTGGTTGRQWLVTGLGLGGLALLLMGVSGLWRDRRRML